MQYYERADLAGPQHDKRPRTESIVTEHTPEANYRQEPVELHGNALAELPGDQAS
jgi:hypothetical protein